MHIDPKRRAGFESRRIPLVIAVTLATTAFSAGLVLGHHLPASGALSDAAGPAMAPMAPAGPVGVTGDPSVPAASDAVGAASNDSVAPASTF